MTLLLAALAALVPQEKPGLQDRWFYFPFDLRDETHVHKFEALAGRAQRAGYNGVLLEDPCFGKLPLMNEAYFRNLDRVKAVAARHGLSIVPALFQLGHSENLLAQDPNLAEGLPVRDALFVVKDGTARLVAEPAVELPPAPAWKDALVSDDLLVRDPRGAFARAVWKSPVRPFRQYHVSAQVRTKEFRGLPRIVVTGGGRLLNYELPKVLPTQDWTEIRAVFNPLEAKEVRITLGAWDGETGEFQWRTPRLEEVALLNVLRRPGAPLVVKTEAGFPLEEGRHFERVSDPRLGTAPKIGGFEEWHAPPPIRTSMPDGTRLRVSYFHPMVFPDGGQMMICFSEPKTFDLLRDQAKRLHAIFKPRAFFMSFDEIRVLNWDDSCRSKNLDAGALVAGAARDALRILRDLDPRAEIYVWNDMFDPVHNAHDHYCLVRGSLAGSWEGLDKDVIIANWYFDRRDESLPFFAGRGHRTLIAGYYDKLPERANEWLDSAMKTKGVTGIMYTSWYDRFDDLERWSALVEKRLAK
jgi:hypothetical protein